MAIAEFAGPSETVLLRRLVTLCSHMSALSSQTTELSPIVDVLAEGIGCGVAMVDRTLETLASAGLKDEADPVTGHATFRTVLTAAARSRRPLAVPSPRGGAVVIAPVLVGEDVAGYLLTLNGTGDSAFTEALFTEDMRLLAVEHAAMVCGLVMGRDLVVTAAAGRARHELVEALLLSSARDDPELDRWARHVGLDFSREHVVLVFDAPSARSGTGPLPVEPLLAAGAPGAVVTARTDEIVAIVPVTGTAPGELARACLSAEQVTAAGVGNPCVRAADIARSYAEARRALEAGRRLGKAGEVSVFADLGIHRLLLRVPDVSDLRAFAEEVLGDAGNEFLATLAAYFRENGSPAKAAQSLGVHPNTVGYRIKRVEELTGLSFAVHRDRLMAEVAVEILAALGGTS
ncbi:MAG: helix-turn-helix domain-containing protein [Streptosporangiaceae bacterium]|jgi:hypothetical protein